MESDCGTIGGSHGTVVYMDSIHATFEGIAYTAEKKPEKNGLQSIHLSSKTCLDRQVLQAVLRRLNSARGKLLNCRAFRASWCGGRFFVFNWGDYQKKGIQSKQENRLAAQPVFYGKVSRIGHDNEPGTS